MNTNFGAKAAGVVLVAVLICQIFSDYFLVNLLRYSQEIEGANLLHLGSENEILAARTIILGVIHPTVTMVVCLLLLKSYFPNELIQQTIKRFGVVGFPSIKFLIVALLCGVTFFLFFSKVLMYFFPPYDFLAAPHPLNVINYAPFIGKLLFAISVVTVVPVSEEFLFRGILYQGISNSWGKLASGTCVSLVFILLHPATIESGYWLTHLALFLFPIYLIVIREITGGIFAPIMAHAGFNFAEIFF